MPILGNKLLKRGVVAPSTRILDNFTDADATALASHAIAPTNVPSTSWVVDGGAFIISANRAQSNGGATQHVADLDSSRANVTIDCDCTNGGDVSIGEWSNVLLRWTNNSNFWYVGDRYNGVSSFLFAITEVNAGVATIRASVVIANPSSETHAIQVVATGAVITATRDGGSSISYNSATLNQTAVRHGLFEKRQTGSNKCKWDNFKVVG